MVLQTGQLLHLPLNEWYFIFTAGGTIASYNLHWYLTNSNDAGSSEPVRVVWTLKHKNILLPLAIGGLIIAAAACWFLKEHWLWLMIGVLLASLYTAPKIPGAISRRLKKIAIAKTIYLAMSWTYVTTVLPVIIAHSVFSIPVIFFMVYRFFLIYAICILFDYRDRENDIKNSIRSLITYFSDKGNNRLYYFSITAALVAAGLFGYYSSQLINGLLLMLPLLLLLWMFPKVKAIHNDYLYYFALDGLMVISLFFTSWL